jgi:CDP-diacylglycerol--glycerol-3-phosphate 3-phosphatidyltransferase
MGAGLIRLPDRAEYRRRWAELHGGASTAGTVGAWLDLVHALAPAAVRLRLAPDVLSVLGVLVSLSALAPAAAGGRWVLAAALLVVLGGVLDGLDGAVAVLTGRATRWGFVLDSLCDRVSDTGYVVALWLLGAPGWACWTGGGLALLHEYVRARAAAGGMAGIGVVTLSERPTRVIVTAACLLGAGLFPGAADAWANVGAAAWVALGVTGLAQLLVAVRRRLR